MSPRMNSDYLQAERVVPAKVAEREERRRIRRTGVMGLARGSEELQVLGEEREQQVVGG